MQAQALAEGLRHSSTVKELYLGSMPGYAQQRGEGRRGDGSREEESK